MLFNAYASTLNMVVPLDTGLNGFADDHSSPHTFSPQVKEDEHMTVEKVTNCLEDTGDWVCRNCLKMNSKKTEVILY